MEADDQLQIFALTDNGTFFEPKADGSPSFALDAATKNGEFLLQNALIANKPDYSSFLDPSFLK